MRGVGRHGLRNYNKGGKISQYVDRISKIRPITDWSYLIDEIPEDEFTYPGLSPEKFRDRVRRELEKLYLWNRYWFNDQDYWIEVVETEDSESDQDLHGTSIEQLA